MKPTLVVLAAGMGSRYGGLKQIDSFGPNGEAIIEYSIFDAIRAGFGKVVFIIRKDIEEAFKAHFGTKFEGKIEVAYAYQELGDLPEGFTLPIGREKPWGTAHALLMAEFVVNEPFAIINADDFYGANAYQVMSDHLSVIANTSTDYALLGYYVKNTLSENGSVSRGVCELDGEGCLTNITERTKIFPNDGAIVFEEDDVLTSLQENTPVSMNFMGFAPSVFPLLKAQFVAFLEHEIDIPKSEFYIPVALAKFVTEKEATVKVLETSAKWFGVTYKEDKEAAQNELNNLIAGGAYPSHLWE